jgi:glycerate 2-kinase
LNTLVEDAIRVWRVGVDAVRADRVVRDQLAWDGKWLTVKDRAYDLSSTRRIVVVGAGKATAGMLAGLLDVFQRPSLTRLTTPNHPPIEGWIQVPEGATASPAFPHDPHAHVQVYQARPQGVNEPTQKVVEGTRKILQLVENAHPDDWVITLISGGGSALLCAPSPGITLETKIAVTRRLSASGATIEQLNAVRRCLSQVKGGGLARRCRARTMLTLVLSDVLGDPLETIASGPTVLDPKPDTAHASHVLNQLCPGEFLELIDRWQHATAPNKHISPSMDDEAAQSAISNSLPSVHHVVLANNATAVAAAVRHAQALGYRVGPSEAVPSQGLAEHVGIQLANALLTCRESDTFDAVISGGEPTVVLPIPALRGRGGRNQHLVLSAGIECLAREREDRNSNDRDYVLLSGGTDGEDGDTSAAGAWIDRQWVRDHTQRELQLRTAQSRCDSHTLLAATGNVLITGPTHTNVCDLRVGLCSKRTESLLP